MTCEEARVALLAGESETALSHISTCRPCQGEEAVWRRRIALLSDPITWEEPTAILQTRILETAESSALKPPLSPSRGKRWEWAVAVVSLVVLAGSYALAQARDPDWRMDLAAFVEGTSATVDGWASENGTRMELQIEGLEAAPPGHYYEIWLTADDGRHVSAGTFRQEGTVTAWAGVRRADFPRIWITLEPMDDELGPSPNTVFDTPR